jgi:hypothetical protein
MKRDHRLVKVRATLTAAMTGSGPGEDGFMAHPGDLTDQARSMVEAEFTLVGINPALDQFRDLARQLRQDAEEQARRHGLALGTAVPSAIAA